MSQNNPGPPRPPQVPPVSPGNPANQPTQPGPAPPMEPVDAPQEAPAPDLEALPYGQHLVDNQQKGPTRESVKKRVGLPGILSIIYSSIYAAVLLLGVGLAILSFMATAAILETARTTGPSGGKEGKGAKAKKLAQERKKEQEARDQQYQTARSALFTSFGIGMVVSFSALTGQMAGIVSGINMVKLRNYRWAFWGNLFAAVPFVSTFYLVLFLITTDADAVGGAAILLMMLIVCGSGDAGRIGISFVCMLCLLGSQTRKFFEMK